MIFVSKDGSYNSTIDKVYKYKPINLITADVLVNFNIKLIMTPYCKDDKSSKIIPLQTNLDLSLFNRKNVLRVVETYNRTRDKAIIECKIDDHKLVPYRYRPDKTSPNKLSVILDNLNVILQMKQSLQHSDKTDCLDLWIAEFQSIGYQKIKNYKTC